MQERLKKKSEWIPSLMGDGGVVVEMKNQWRRGDFVFAINSRATTCYSPTRMTGAWKTLAQRFTNGAYVFKDLRPFIGGS